VARVLVVDDEPGIRTALVRGLGAEGMEVEAVGDGHAALAALRARSPDLIIADVMMPGLDGFALLGAVRADAALRGVPVILLSARAGEEARVEGLEALVRWQHPTRGMIPPLDFIPLAEETGMIVSLGRWVLQEACLQARRLQERYVMDPPLQMAVNLSARQLQRPEIVGEIAEILMETRLDPGSLVLEITESVMMQDMELSIQRLAELKDLGVQLAVDDFGTGYSSLNYIRRFPVDILKVDKSFVDGVNEGGEESALTAAIIELAGILRLRPVAEGIERADQLEKLLDLHCDLGQGYYFAKPLTLRAVDELLTTRQTLETRETELSS